MAGWGRTTVAPMNQATLPDYPGVKLEMLAGERLLFDLENDPAESTDCLGNIPRYKRT